MQAQIGVTVAAQIWPTPDTFTGPTYTEERWAGLDQTDVRHKRAIARPEEPRNEPHKPELDPAHRNES